MEEAILFKNGQKIAVIGCLEATMPRIRQLGKSALKENYEKFGKAVDELEQKLEMFPEQEFWIGWDLCHEAYVEQFQKQNRALLPGTLIGVIK